MRAHEILNLIRVIALFLGISILLSGCGLALLAVEKVNSIPTRCGDFRLKDRPELNYTHKFSEEVREQNLTGEDAAFYIARAKVQDLHNVYRNLTQFCQEEFSSQLDLCKGYALKYVLAWRSTAYYSDLNPNVYPLDDVEYDTATFQSYYDALSDSTKKKIEDPESYDNPKYFLELGRVFTAADEKANKTQFVNQTLQDTYLKSAPNGVSDPNLEPVVVAYIQKLNPELKVQTVVFDDNWIINKRWNSDTNKYEEILNKSRVAAVTVEVPNETQPYVLSLFVNIQMDYEGGGNYGEPHGEGLVTKLPKNHTFDLMSNKRDFSERPHLNRWIEHGEIEYRKDHITYDNRWRLYDYHDITVFLPLQP